MSFHVLVLVYAAFLYVLLKTRESKCSYSMPAQSNSELANTVLILSPRRRVVSLLLSKTCLRQEMIKDHPRPPAAIEAGRRSYLQRADFSAKGWLFMNIPH